MKIDQLIYFTETAREEHIGRAAKILGISSSAISHSIAALEGELQVKLFQKKGKNIFLTNEGRNLLEKSQGLIYQFKNLKADIMTKAEDKSHYSIVASHSISSKFVSPAWINIQKEYAKTSIDLLTLRSSEVVREVLERRADIGICFSPQEHPELEIYPIHKGELVINVKKKHPILKTNKPILSITEYPAVLPKSFQGIDICLQHPMFEKFNIKPQATCLMDSYDISFELIKRSDYWGLTPDILINSKDFNVIKPAKGWCAPYNLSMVIRKNQYRPSFYEDLLNEVKKSIVLLR
jgi:DNA-binding transcriptional LysR family regulator